MTFSTVSARSLGAQAKLNLKATTFRGARRGKVSMNGLMDLSTKACSKTAASTVTVFTTQLRVRRPTRVTLRLTSLRARGS